jgi:GNAT superfamily N-acetyltransferase
MGEVGGPLDFSSRPRRLSAGDAVADFNSGEPELDDWLKRRAFHNESEGASRTYVITSGSIVAGFYTLATGGVARESLPGAVRRNMPDPIPVMILGRLAIDSRFQGQGLGAALLKDAILRTLQVAEIAGVRALLVHPISESAARFYRRRGFIESSPGARFLVLPLKSVSTNLG